MQILFDEKILIFFTGIAHFVLAWIIFQKSKKNSSNISFALFTLSLGVWSVLFYFYFHPIIFSPLIWIKLVYSTGFLTAPCIIYFFFNFPSKRIRSLLLFIITYIIVVLPLFLMLFFTDLWVKEVIIYPWGPQTVTGKGYLYFLFYAIIALGIITYSLIRNYLLTTGVIKDQLKFVFLGILLYGLPTIYVDIILPLMRGDSGYFWLSPIFSLSIVIFTAYAITRYRLMDIKIVIGKGAVYLFSFLTVIGLAFSFMLLANQFLSPLNPNTILLIGTSSSLLFFNFLKFYEKIAEEYFYHSFYNTKIIIAELEEKLTQVLEIDTLVSLVNNTLINTLKIEKIAILFRKVGSNIFLPKNLTGFSEEKALLLASNNFLLDYLERTKKPIIQEELELLTAKENNDKIKEIEQFKEQMKQAGAKLMLPFIFEKKLIAIIILGKKISNESFSYQDIELLNTFSRSASIALKNASLYSELKSRKEELEHFYSLTVGRELKIKELKDKIKELEGK